MVLFLIRLGDQEVGAVRTAAAAVDAAVDVAVDAAVAAAVQLPLFLVAAPALAPSSRVHVRVPVVLDDQEMEVVRFAAVASVSASVAVAPPPVVADIRVLLHLW